MGLIDYKAKYMGLKAKYMSTVDLSWRLGYEQGLKDAQIDQMQQQQQQADAIAQQQNMGQPGQPGQSGEEAAPGEEANPAPISENPNGNELDQHIEKLESMLGKSEITPFELQDLKKTLNDIRSLQTQISLSKSMESIKNAKMDHGRSVISFSPKTQANLPEQSKKALSLQQDIVNSVFSKWEKEESKAASDISSIIKMEGLTKKEG